MILNDRQIRALIPVNVLFLCSCIASTEGISDGHAAASTSSTAESENGTTLDVSVTTSEASSSDTTIGPNDLPDGGPCDPFSQPDCPNGYKCAPYASDGGSIWDANKCVPVEGDGEPGDACIMFGTSTSGHDSCNPKSVCIADETLNGFCVELCLGSEADPECPAGNACLIANSGTLTLCKLICDPLKQNCLNNEICIPDVENFLCIHKGVGAPQQIFAPCESKNACDAGLFCAAPDNGTECDQEAIGCCLPFCDLDDPDPTCPGMGQSCHPWFMDGPAPPNQEDVGYCAL